MRSMLLEEFARNIILLPDNKLRNQGKHQKRIKELQNVVRELGECGSIETAHKLISIKSIRCRGSTEYVAHLRYLQYCVNYLRENIQKYGGV